MLRKALLFAVVMIAVPGLAYCQDEGPKWGYIQGGYIDFSPDQGDSSNGAFLGGSMHLGKMFHIVAEYDDVGDLNFWTAGFGWHGWLGDKADLFAQANWNDYDTDNGFSFDLGARWDVVKWLEIYGQGRWVDLDEGDSDALIRVGAMAMILDGKLGFGADWETGDSDTVRAYVRWSFR